MAMQTSDKAASRKAAKIMLARIIGPAMKRWQAEGKQTGICLNPVAGLKGMKRFCGHPYPAIRNNYR
jgi:hypothetical protein